MRYLVAVAAVAVAFVLRKLLEPFTGIGAPFVLFFGAILVVSIATGARAGIVALLLSIPAGSYFVVRAGFPRSQVVFQALLFGIDASVIVYLSAVAARARRAAELAAARIENVLDLAPDAFVLVDANGTCVDGNRAACRLLGYAREELLGKSIADFSVDGESWVPDGDLEPFLAERHLRRSDGTLVSVELSAARLPDGRAQAFMRDITERKRIEDERSIFVALLDNSSDFIGVADATGKPIYVNPAGRRMVALPADIPVEHTQIPDYYPPAQRAFASDVILKSMLERGHWSGETYFRNWQTGAAIPVSDDHFLIRDPGGGRVLGMGTITRDISDAKRIASEREQLLASERAARARAEAIAEQLRESEERFRLTIEEAPIGMALVALDGRFVRVNEALCRIVGYGSDELLRLRFQDITHPDDADLDVALAVQLGRGEIPRYQLEKRYLRKDGSIVTVLLAGSVLRDRDGAAQYYIAQVVDITDRKRAEDMLKLSEARLSGIISISADAIILVDADQRITRFNRGAEAIFGYRADEVVGGPLDVLIPERFRARHRTDVATFATGPTTARRMGERADVVGRRKNGDEFPAQASISRLIVNDRLTLTVALRDISDQMRIERELQFLARTGRELVSLSVPQTLEQIGRVAVQELADCCVVDLIAPPQRKIVAARAEVARVAARLEPIDVDRLPVVDQVIDTKQAVLVEQVDIDAAGFGAEQAGMLRAIDARSIMALPLEIRGELRGVVTLISSRPSRVYGARELRLAESFAGRATLAIENARLYQTAVQATRLRDQVIGVVAHDLRNPLGVVQLQAEALRGSSLEANPLDAILHSADRMNRLIQDLLDVTKLEAGHFAVEHVRVDTSRLLVESVESQRVLARKRSLELRLDAPTALPAVLGDSHRLLQVFENLVGNAIKFTPPHGLITIGAVAHERDVLFRVQDTGPGIPAESLPRVFDRFWQASTTQRQGAGLGLVIARGIVEAHGGKIWVESEPGHGATFYFTVPQAPPLSAPWPEMGEHPPHA
ncbi:MAG TPA: PAS domain S-box protein [Kofleriaceae bacterium]|nr:PAS domain S-box protein [Kofleriaceae bacterium]